MNADAKEFQIPSNLNASTPPEKRGASRDRVRLMVMDRTTGKTIHGQFTDLASYLKPGDLLVMNNSRTIPSVLRGKQGTCNVEIRLSRQLSDRQWDALVLNGLCKIGEMLILENGITATIIGNGSERPLVRLLFSKGGVELFNMIFQFGEPIRYEYIDTTWPLETYQTVYATIPGSVEMASAGRAFSWRLINHLKKKGVQTTFLQLHAGLSYYGDDHWPTPSKHPEQFHISEQTTEIVNRTRKDGGRVIAVGTTVVRALESASDHKGQVTPQDRLTDLYIKEGYPLKVVDGLLTGFHEPEASHLHLLTAFIKKDYLLKSYHEALGHEYLWHEFGDMNLILPMENE
ncbi:S-adenosylmethionine:tRNA ribosyltransferase-isomerase [Bacillus sp. FJAT-49732]|uniref:S-adenosylmethionine:tRNA ribosyltransferase-isomerase n=1 Tax=Lederbergia citrisecunda TaxID=2833583 RepID=A0A942YLW0_9BACI|nr:S-adenosylmethionine:tRNA ribosyltransferase-isomerase [Lederbergia citrisecunda]MBS4200809.1 S-adenosylmethionine:tRNA ribosyltransferase-isomerase [Lederbergia citrisecunda]